MAGATSSRGINTMSLKRLSVAIVGATVLAFGLAACGGDDDSADATTPAAQTTAGGGGGGGGPVKIIASVPPTDHGWLGAISKNAQKAADQYDDVDFQLLEAADADSQAQQIEQAISQKPDALVVLPQDGAALTPVAQKAEAGGHPGRQHRPPVHHPGRGDRHDPGRQLPDRRAGGGLHQRAAELPGQRGRDPGSRRHLGDHRPHQGLHRRAEEGRARTAGSRSSPRSRVTSTRTPACA